jgi:pimeloyl-ACP methyl ester carboxylesterase
MSQPVSLLRPDGEKLSCLCLSGTAPTVMFLGGFRSSMDGDKATALAGWAERTGHACVRHDYYGFGQSSGDWEKATLGRWIVDALAVLDTLTKGPVILVGSSMGAWIALHLAEQRPQRIAGLCTIAAAPDFTTDTLPARFEAQTGSSMEDWLNQNDRFTAPSTYEPEGYVFTRRLIEEAGRHLVLTRDIAVNCPVRLLHGTEDADIPPGRSMKLMQALPGPDTCLTLVKGGDHRLARAQDIALITATVSELMQKAAS